MKKTLVILAAILIAAAAGFSSYWHFASPEKTCLSCHEIRSAGEIWAQSSHRNAPCADCHGTALSNGWHSLRQNARRVLAHFRQERHEAIRLTEPQVVEMTQRCRKCHEREYAGWLSSGHSASYADIFLNDAHNSMEQPQDDCLRCHGMFFEGTIRDIVTPLSTKGPWKLVRGDLADRPAIPCMTCHEVHQKGLPAGPPEHRDPKAILYGQAFRAHRPSFYDRREGRHFEVGLLPQPQVMEGERAVEMAGEPRQRLCYQCHAPAADHQALTSDDRTPRGVHEGLSCFACHVPHSMEVRSTCADCHPRLSNCGLDVEKMDTSFAKADSRHNVHFVKCADCHTKGVPPRKQRTS